MFGLQNVPLTWTLEFQFLKGTGLRAADSGGTSDPYIVFSGEACIGEPMSQHLDKTTDPSWTSEQLPTLTLVAEGPKFLVEDNLLFCIMDRDRVTADDLIGCSVLTFKNLVFEGDANPFKNKWAADGKAHASFKITVLYAGIEQGTLEGGVTITESEPLSLQHFWETKYSLKRKSSFTSTLLGRSVSKTS